LGLWPLTTAKKIEPLTWEREEMELESERAWDETLDGSLLE